MTEIQLIILGLAVGFLGLLLIFTLSIYAHYRFLLYRISLFIEVIQKVNEKKTNFVLQRVHSISKNSPVLSNLVASWSIEAKEMRATTAMASLHTKHLINLVGEGKLIEATRYSQTLLQSVQIFESQWDDMIGDMNRLINFAHHPVSLITEQKQQYAEIDTIRKKIVGSRPTKTSKHLRKISESIENDFESFESVWLKGDFVTSLEYVKKIRKKLRAYLDILQNMPIVVYLVGVVFRSEKELFRKIHHQAEKEGLIMGKIKPLERFNQYIRRVAELNEPFIEGKVSSFEIADYLIDEIMKLKKMNILLLIELSCKERYLTTSSVVLDSYEKVRFAWKEVKNKNLFKYHSEGTVADLEKEYMDLKTVFKKQQDLKNQNPLSLYSELLGNLALVSKQVQRFKEKVSETLEEALNFEKEREIKIGEISFMLVEVKTFYQIQTSTRWSHIRNYIEKEVKTLFRDFEIFKKFANDAKYSEFRQLRLEEKDFRNKFLKLKWEIETLGSNEVNVRNLYEIANRYRSESKYVNSNLDKAEIHISFHEVREAYDIIRRVLKEFDPKALKKYPVVFK